VVTTARGSSSKAPALVDAAHVGEADIMAAASSAAQRELASPQGVSGSHGMQ
jgi:hypothetical protein